jgi:predicted nucleic acid-binding protein
VGSRSASETDCSRKWRKGAQPVALYLLDTNHACRLLDPDDPLWARLFAKPADRFAVSLATVGELAYMVEKSARRRENWGRLDRLLASLVIPPFTPVEAIRSGRVRGEAQRRGYSLSAVDAQIAAR